MTDPENDLRNIGISPRERLERIESLLGRMDEKLDNKADAATVLAMSLRIAALEQTEAARVAAEKVADTQEEQFHYQMRAEMTLLEKEHNELKRQIAYYAGGLVVVLFVAEEIARRFI